MVINIILRYYGHKYYSFIYIIAFELHYTVAEWRYVYLGWEGGTVFNLIIKKYTMKIIIQGRNMVWAYP